MIYVACGSLIVADVIITASMCYLLANARTGFESTNSKIISLISYTVSTGIVTSLCSIATIASWAANDQSFVGVAMEFILVKLYINSFMTMMNARYYQGDNAPACPAPAGIRTKSTRMECKHQINFGRKVEYLNNVSKEDDKSVDLPDHVNSPKRLTVSIESSADQLTFEQLEV
ncbi:hypothetical protein SERLA73DRAFT_189422 [Serpula lacrymans var. lacrymans S7.3]|uniref:DUF6534 domain-containing protein n=2 Tax=Serpula lacrymans var. lacrymans TaxID=341189 RepID=F8QDM4_SERL3|nr:uncharacterized protein SERLADRAFT_480235 [Serpula lacrymans var. lacrymans S7.9]EGN93695.1 hypothetical protein SERLA73DRAFT_189422 [Serpula lacrymans var. lacrymans S7.3]EGO19065.1 hypothetical protein SERLADRAFT_480235 [Serpula lacrymans var. lacrymans S7.9]